MPLFTFQLFSPAVVERLNDWENMLVISGQCTLLALNARLLYAAKVQRPPIRMVPSMQLFLALHWVCTLSALPISLQKNFAVFPVNESTIPLNFWISALHNVYNLSVGSFFTLFLTVDRLLVVRAPLSPFRRHWVSIAFASSAALYCTSMGFFVAELPLNPRDALKCGSLIICIAPHFNYFPQNVMKISIGYANLASSILFLRMLRGVGLQKKIKNRAVKFTLICEILCNLIPSQINVLLKLLTGASLSSYVGVADLLLIVVELVSCSAFYAWLFLVRSATTTQVVRITPTAGHHQLQQFPNNRLARALNSTTHPGQPAPAGTGMH